jgi:hypothetical protein
MTDNKNKKSQMIMDFDSLTEKKTDSSFEKKSNVIRMECDRTTQIRALAVEHLLRLGLIKERP